MKSATIYSLEIRVEMALRLYTDEEIYHIIDMKRYK